MDNLYLIGIDLAKNIFHLHGVDEKGAELFRKKLSRKKLSEFIKSLPKTKIAMEACGGSSFFYHQFKGFGHEVMLIPAQFVKAYIKTNKNDAIDSAGICKAAMDPDIRFAKARTRDQQDIMLTHRSRSRLIKQRTALGNELRGFLGEYGMICAQGGSYLKKKIEEELVSEKIGCLSEKAKQLFAKLYQEFLSLEINIKEHETMLVEVLENNPLCKKLMKIPGIGLITATALVGEIGDGSGFANGRDLASYLGLVPRQHSTGGKQRLLGISKRGNRYLRTLHIHGARSILASIKRRESREGGKDAKNKTPLKETEFSKNKRLSQWFRELRTKKPDNVAVVALANKLSRICWAALRDEEGYKINVRTKSEIKKFKQQCKEKNKP